MVQLTLRASAMAILMAAGAASASADELRLAIKDGRVTLVADSVPVSKILEEWARVGQSRILNLEKLAGPPVTLRLTDVPEKQALDVLLRTAAGYMAAPRAAGVPGVSQFDRIMILATSKAPAASAGAPSSSRPPPFVPPAAQPAVDDQTDPDEEADAEALPPAGGAPPVGPGGVRAPVFPQPNPLPFQGTGAEEEPPSQGAPAPASPRPGLPTTSEQQSPPVTSPAGGLSPVPGFTPTPASPASPPGTAQKPPPKKPGGGSS